MRWWVSGVTHEPNLTRARGVNGRSSCSGEASTARRTKQASARPLTFLFGGALSELGPYILERVLPLVDQLPLEAVELADLDQTLAHPA